MQGKIILDGFTIDGASPSAIPQDVIDDSEMLGLSLETMEHPATCECTVCLTVARMEFQLIDA